MQRIHITDPGDARVADYTRLTDVSLRKRREPERGMYIAESNSVVRRAVEAGHRPRSFLMNARSAEALGDVLSEFPDVPVYWGDDDVLESLTGFHLHRGALAAMERPVLPDVAAVLAGARRVAILEDIVDHTNVGAIFRSAAGIGVDAVLVTPRCADPLYRRSIRVSMGAVFQVPWTRIEPWPAEIDQLQAQGFVVAGMTLGEEAVSLDALAAEGLSRLALVFGTEGHGLSAGADRRLDRRVTIPMMHGVDSLNVAAASAVAFYATR